MIRVKATVRISLPSLGEEAALAAVRVLHEWLEAGRSLRDGGGSARIGVGKKEGERTSPLYASEVPTSLSIPIYLNCNWGQRNAARCTSSNRWRFIPNPTTVTGRGCHQYFEVMTGK